ncbi:MAG: glycosyltransferase family 4 protein [Asticcacaulis sp.]
MSRILFIALATYNRVGGLQNFNRRLIRNLDGLVAEGSLSSCRVHIMDDTAADLPQMSHANVTGFGRNRLKFITESLSAVRTCDQLIVGHVNLVPVACLLKALKPSLKITLFVHGDEVWNDVLRQKHVYEPWLLKAVDRVASVSAYTADVMSREYGVPRARFVIYPNVVDDFADPPQRPLDTATVLCVTRIGPGDRRKNVDRLIEAMGVLAQRGRPGRLVVVGGGALREEYEALAAAKGIADRVEFTGRISDEELNQRYAGADLFALPSSKEGFGIVYLEAWSHGLPVICSCRGAPHEIVSDGVDGFVVDETDVDTFADRIDAILSDPERAARMGRAGLTKVRENYLNGRVYEGLRQLLVEAR